MSNGIDFAWYLYFNCAVLHQTARHFWKDTTPAMLDAIAASVIRHREQPQQAQKMSLHDYIMTGGR